MKSFLIIAGTILVGILLLFVIQKGSSSFSNDLSLGVLHSTDNVKGTASSSVVIMEYSDFECPACRSYYPIVREVVQEFGGQIAFVYRHFPLTSIHKNAEYASRASESAKKQGKFWEMHDLLFEKQSEWADSKDPNIQFKSYAKLLSLDLNKFEIDINSDEVKNFVRGHRLHAIKSGLNGTPTFFINGEKISNPKSAEEFKTIVRNIILNQK